MTRPQALLNFWRGEANHLPEPRHIGEWTVSRGGCVFRVEGETDPADGLFYIFWRLCDAQLAGSKFIFRITESTP